METKTDKALTISLALVFTLGVALGWFIHSHFFNGDLLSLKDKINQVTSQAQDYKYKYEKERDKEPQKIAVKGDTVFTHTIEYLPKPTNPDGTPDTSKSQADVVVTGKQDFTIDVNGKPAKFAAAPTERFVFDKNQIQWDQMNQVHLDLEVAPVVIDRTRYHQIVLGADYDIDKKKATPGASYSGPWGKHGAYEVMGSQNHIFVGVGRRVDF